MEWNVIPPYSNTKVTLELREIVENGVDLWDFDYPSYYTGEEKKAFEKKVIDHYYFRQIGQETVGRFLHYFRTRIREIMPLYLQRYKSCEWLDKIEDPLESYNLTEEYTATHENRGATTATDNGRVENNGENKKVVDSSVTDSGVDATEFSDTPQGSVGQTVNDGFLTNFTRLTKSNAHIDDTTETDTLTNTAISESTSIGSTNDSGENTYKLTRRGNIGVQPLGGEINNIRSAFLNVDMEIIEELKDLFLMVY